MRCALPSRVLIGHKKSYIDSYGYVHGTAHIKAVLRYTKMRDSYYLHFSLFPFDKEIDVGEQAIGSTQTYEIDETFTDAKVDSTRYTEVDMSDAQLNEVSAGSTVKIIDNETLTNDVALYIENLDAKVTMNGVDVYITRDKYPAVVLLLPKGVTVTVEVAAPSEAKGYWARKDFAANTGKNTLTIEELDVNKSVIDSCSLDIDEGYVHITKLPAVSEVAVAIIGLWVPEASSTSASTSGGPVSVEV